MRMRVLAGFGVAAALLALTACRSSPEVAAYVGDTAITEQQVTVMLNDFNAVAPEQEKVSRMTVLQYLVGEQLCNRLSREQGFTFEPKPVQHGVPDFVSLVSRAGGCFAAIPVSGRATEAELREVHLWLVARGETSAPFEQDRPALEGDQNLQTLLARQRALKQASEASDVTINPRYAGLKIPLLNQQLANRMDKPDSSGVVDAPRPAVTAPAL